LVILGRTSCVLTIHNSIHSLHVCYAFPLGFGLSKEDNSFWKLILGDPAGNTSSQRLASNNSSRLRFRNRSTLSQPSFAAMTRHVDFAIHSCLETRNFRRESAQRNHLSSGLLHGCAVSSVVGQGERAPKAIERGIIGWKFNGCITEGRVHAFAEEQERIGRVVLSAD